MIFSSEFQINNLQTFHFLIQDLGCLICLGFFQVRSHNLLLLLISNKFQTRRMQSFRLYLHHIHRWSCLVVTMSTEESVTTLESNSLTHLGHPVAVMYSLKVSNYKLHTVWISSSLLTSLSFLNVFIVLCTNRQIWYTKFPGQPGHNCSLLRYARLLWSWVWSFSLVASLIQTEINLWIKFINQSSINLHLFCHSLITGSLKESLAQHISWTESDYATRLFTRRHCNFNDRQKLRASQICSPCVATDVLLYIWPWNFQQIKF